MNIVMAYEIPNEETTQMVCEPPFYATPSIDGIIRKSNLSTALTANELKARLHEKLEERFR